MSPPVRVLRCRMMAMRFGEYLATLTPDAQRAVIDDLTLGAGRVALAARLHVADPQATTMLGTLAAAYTALHAALEALGDAVEQDSPPTARTPADRLTERWAAMVARAGPEVVGTWLQMAAEMTRDAAAAAAQDADVSVVRELLRHALDALATVRDDALGAP